jgi:glucosamine-6-phosphate deaminase
MSTLPEPRPIRRISAGTGPIRIATRICPDAASAARCIAEAIAETIRAAAAAGRTCVLGLPTGGTPVPVYRQLVAWHRAGTLGFRHVIAFNLDEYHGLPRSSPRSYWRFMHAELFDHVDIDPANVHLPRGDLPEDEVAEHAADYERAIAAAGGIDLMLLGIGRNGHIGFNEPGSPLCSRTRLVRLAPSTRSAATGDFAGHEPVPTAGVTMGVATILAARRVLLLAGGVAKAAAVAAAVEGPAGLACPASFLQGHPDAEVVCDADAASALVAVRKPWLVGPVDWSEPTIRAAVIDVAVSTGRPLLALSVADYHARGLGELLDRHGPADRLNLETFRGLVQRITGWPGGKPPDRRRPGDIPQCDDEVHPKTVLVFSPHPDDDVIGMGGTIARLCEHGHAVHIAYQTAGHRGVHDDDLVRHLEFVAGAFRLAGLPAPDLAAAPRASLKALVRRTEAVAAAALVGVPAERLHFIDSPLYERGAAGDDDLARHVALLEQVRPHQLYAAGDLADPNGTHRRCLRVLRAALLRCAGSPWFAGCSRWLYRGAWDAYGAEELERAVPLSPTDVLRKRQAILRHQSQKDRVMFPGDDVREFWQRAEDRTREAAQGLDRLGLAQYAAVEVFARFRMETEP